MGDQYIMPLASGDEAFRPADPDDVPTRPHIASRSQWARIEALQDLKRFRAEHAAAVQGEQASLEVTHPYGSYRAKLLGRRCAQAP